MGEVYRAIHTKLGRVAAVKVLTRADGDAHFTARFLNEARIHARLSHPGIATLYEFHGFRGRPCIIMEFVSGETLDRRIGPERPLPLPAAVSVFRAIVEAV